MLDIVIQFRSSLYLGPISCVFFHLQALMKKLTPKVMPFSLPSPRPQLSPCAPCGSLCSVRRRGPRAAAGERRRHGRAAARAQRLHLQRLQHAVREKGGPHCLLTFFPRAILQDLHQGQEPETCI